MREALRLYPPVYNIHRQPTEDIELGGYHIPKGTCMYVCMYVHVTLLYITQIVVLHCVSYVGVLYQDLPDNIMITVLCCLSGRAWQLQHDSMAGH